MLLYSNLPRRLRRIRKRSRGRRELGGSRSKTITSRLRRSSRNPRISNHHPALPRLLRTKRIHCIKLLGIVHLCHLHHRIHWGRLHSELLLPRLLSIRMIIQMKIFLFLLLPIVIIALIHMHHLLHLIVEIDENAISHPLHLLNIVLGIIVFLPLSDTTLHLPLLFNIAHYTQHLVDIPMPVAIPLLLLRLMHHNTKTFPMLIIIPLRLFLIYDLDHESFSPLNVLSSLFGL